MKFFTMFSQILRHTRETPFILVGKADVQFTERLGNYEITEIEGEKSPCLSYDLQTRFDESEGETLFVTFTTPSDQSVSQII